MDVKYLKYTEKEFNQIIKYYIGTPKIYKYCYEHSPEFKEFIDNSNDEFKKAIKKCIWDIPDWQLETHLYT